MNNFFANQPSNLGRGGSDPLGPLGYFGLPLANPDRSPLPPNKPYY